MCEAAHFAGKAINISKTTAPHALSYWLTTQYGVPHGAAVALFVGRFVEFNAGVSIVDCNDRRGPDDVQRRISKLLGLLGVKDAASGRGKLEELISKLGCPVTLRDVGICGESEVTTLCAKVNAERLSNNPRKIGFEQLVELLAK
jgi:alcohol dehydrogenase class IV